MKIKNTIKGVALSLGALVAFSSCEDYLDVTQPSIYTIQNLYKTPSDCEAAIAGVYSQLQKVYNCNYQLNIMYREDCIKNMNNNVTRFTDTASEKSWETAYKSLWTLIERSNEVLDNIGNASFSDESQREHIKGEAHAMRGLAYLQMAWCWGGCPIINTGMPLSELRKIKRASQGDTYMQAIDDFKLAYEMLPESRSGKDVGRVTKYAMAAMLGRTYMYMHDYEAAAKWLKDVVDQEPRLYKMADNYSDCFDDKFDNTPERVWEVQYMSGTSAQALGVSQQLYSMLLPSSISLQKDAHLLYDISFQGPSGTAQVSESLYQEGIYEEGDSRRDDTMVTGLYFDKDYVNNDAYVARKFLKATGSKPAAFDQWGNNISIIRYTDVKMMYAEALNEINSAGNSTIIFSILNEVRRRASLGEIDPGKLDSKEKIFDYIVHERFVEFCFEGLRWPDLIRWGLAEEAMKKHFSLKNEGYNSASEAPLYSMSKRNLLAPIPQSEISAYNDDSVMWQNEGY